MYGINEEHLKSICETLKAVLLQDGFQGVIVDYGYNSITATVMMRNQVYGYRVSMHEQTPMHYIIDEIVKELTHQAIKCASDTREYVVALNSNVWDDIPLTTEAHKYIPTDEYNKNIKVI